MAADGTLLQGELNPTVQPAGPLSTEDQLIERLLTGFLRALVAEQAGSELAVRSDETVARRNGEASS